MLDVIRCISLVIKFQAQEGADIFVESQWLCGQQSWNIQNMTPQHPLLWFQPSWHIKVMLGRPGSFQAKMKTFQPTTQTGMSFTPCMSQRLLPCCQAYFRFSSVCSLAIRLGEGG